MAPVVDLAKRCYHPAAKPAVLFLSVDGEAALPGGHDGTLVELVPGAITHAHAGSYGRRSHDHGAAPLHAVTYGWVLKLLRLSMCRQATDMNRVRLPL